ncbi:MULTISPECIES: hypothetical protein [unclassified Synechococcus]|uniref:hypothetical protein n=1 Tax=unclassified Synechococcus TaxID=2626047 RepID=UPI000B9947CB|nr:MULTISPECIES: hypothetical protein [unclassified Synechococcus]MCP9847085.1 hypothetical protein [Synechococcus sp. Lug-A]MCT0209182.1 hypothetical protein [Synechococcus sp. CS-1333]PZV20676.1 MAG: hypothetical protein DCF18_13615 [Cyanobium sp.]
MASPLSLDREFTVAMHSRTIDDCDDIEALRAIAKTLLEAWQLQAMFSEDYGAQLLRVHAP